MVEFIFEQVGNDLRLATALGLGKPNDLLNAIYATVQARSELQLQIYTALSLNPPRVKSHGPSASMEDRFLGPFVDRHFGGNYPRLQFADDQKNSGLCDRVRVHEFYLQPGEYRHSPMAQRDYISLNYTHVAPALYDRGVNAVVQLVAKRGDRYSLGSNPDLTRDLMDLYRRRGRRLVFIGVVHPEMPFMESDAELAATELDAVLETSDNPYSLFAMPKPEVDAVDHHIGLHTSQLIADDGTLQIGIGSLSDAVVHSLILRHQHGDIYKKCIADVSNVRSGDLKHWERFEHGLYGTSELLMDGFMHLRRTGILRRQIFDLDEKRICYLHAAFFLGSKDLYAWLRGLEGEDLSGLRMTRVSKVNDLYDANEFALRKQRKNARFVNTAMKVSLLGSAASDTLESGLVVSGVGGQYNFVAMSHELEDARSILMLRSARVENGRRVSNIVWRVANETISRHLRDLVVTEYGVADLRGKTDEECVKALIEIADSEFQPELSNTAKHAGKLSLDYQIPEYAVNNRPDRLKKNLEHFPPYPFGSDFTAVELRLLEGLKRLKKMSKPTLAWNILCGMGASRSHAKDELERMDLSRPRSLKELIYAGLLVRALDANSGPETGR